MAKVANASDKKPVTLKGLGVDKDLFEGKNYKAKADKKFSTEVLAQKQMKQMFSIAPKAKKKETD